MEATAAETGDYVGVESCIDLRNEEEFDAYVRDCERSYERRHRKEAPEVVAAGGAVRRENKVREFPPPITYLTRTENQSSHMPWVMRRYYTDDGRLVIREEKAKHHEYLRAHRADGRLTLHLIPLNREITEDSNDANDNVDDIQTEDDANNNVDDAEIVNENVEEEKVGNVTEEDEVVEEGNETAALVMVSSVSMAALCITEGVRSGGMLTSASSSCLTPTGGKKCYGFNSLRSSSASSLFHLQVPAIRPVIS